MSAMSTRTVLFLVIFFVFAFVSESAPPKRPTEDGSGELPSVVDNNDKNLETVDPALAEEDAFRADKFNGRRTPPDYEYKGPADSDYDNKFNKPGKSHEISPDFGERPLGGRGVHDEDNEIHKSEDEDEESGIDKKGDGDYDEEQEGEIDHSFEDKNSNIPIDEDEEKYDKDDDESRDDDRDSVDVPNDYDDEDDKSDDVPSDFFGGFLFNSPFFNVRQVTKYFQQLEKALEHVFRQTMDEVRLLNGTYANTTEEEVEINGKKYIVQKSIIKGKDNNSSIYVEALSTVPKVNGTLKVKDSGL